MQSEPIATSITGVYETHLPVRDLDRSIAFYRDRLGLELATEIPERQIAFFWVGRREIGMLGLWQVGTGPLQMRLHFAFRTQKEAVITASETLRSSGIEPLDFHGNPTEEPVVIGWAPSLSVYFKDPDGHSLELIHMLDEAPDPGFGIGPLSAWMAHRRRTDGKAA
ncbi:VOC family protein [Rhizobium sp. CSW-27]|uniref:VOC family protein n=1 Tax=Rhizobium sp. CSW-27 TaxID=2839985 RepID=UPI001C02BB8B|nr:VOC family protein [Rhizobium sp. CSW-27]MBT9368860.1 VOC family protein [Rhizobium sp. CSW-27]